MTGLKTATVLGLIALLAAGCAASNPAPPADPPVQAEHSVAAPGPGDEGGLKMTHLEQLWQSRRSNFADFPIGTGDVIAVSVPGLPDFDNSHGGGQGMGMGMAGGAQSEGAALDNWTVRVGSEGNINLPLLGRVHAAGLTEEQLRDELRGRLLKYMYDPQVEVSVRSYNSRRVAIAGEVHAPGMYTITAPNETIRDMIMRAGGTTDGAAPRVIVTPATPKGRNLNLAHPPASDPQPDADAPRVSDTNALAVGGLGGISNTYVIDLSKGQYSRYLNIPVRPGDTIYVPRAGTATVVGWVHAPRTVDITPGLTVLDAISEAGGPLFAADTNTIKILRQAPGEETKTLVVNLNEIKDARAPDVLVQANDVIDVSYSAVRIPGYALYYGAQAFIQLAPTALLYSGGL